MESQNNYVKRTQRDYTLSFKIQVVKEIESGLLSATESSKKYGIQGESTVRKWLQKYGKFDWENQTSLNMPKSPEQKILELEAKVRLLEKQKAQLEQRSYIADQKAVIFDMMIDIAEKEYSIDIRKNLPPEQSAITARNKKKV
jgi:transposase-like protein